MFKYFLISIVLAPVFIGITAAKGRKGGGDRTALRVGWMVYAVLWFGTLYLLRYKWGGGV